MSYTSPNAWAYEEDLPSFCLDVAWYMPQDRLPTNSVGTKRPIADVYTEEVDDIDDVDYVFGGDWKRRHAAYCPIPRRHRITPATSGRSRKRSVHGRKHLGPTTSAPIEGFSSFKFSFSFLIRATRATDATRIKQRQQYPPYRSPTSTPTMKPVYCVPQISLTLEAYLGLYGRIASAMGSALIPSALTASPSVFFSPQLDLSEECTVSTPSTISTIDSMDFADAYYGYESETMSPISPGLERDVNNDVPGAKLQFDHAGGIPKAALAEWTLLEPFMPVPGYTNWVLQQAIENEYWGSLEADFI